MKSLQLNRLKISSYKAVIIQDGIKIFINTIPLGSVNLSGGILLVGILF